MAQSNQRYVDPHIKLMYEEQLKQHCEELTRQFFRKIHASGAKDPMRAAARPNQTAKAADMVKGIKGW